MVANDTRNEGAERITRLRLKEICLLTYNRTFQAVDHISTCNETCIYSVLICRLSDDYGHKYRIQERTGGAELWRKTTDFHLHNGSRRTAFTQKFNFREQILLELLVLVQDILHKPISR